MKTYGLVLCQSADGWSLHDPGATDEQIAAGEELFIICGLGEPTQGDYDTANSLIAAEPNSPPT